MKPEYYTIITIFAAIVNCFLLLFHLALSKEIKLLKSENKKLLKQLKSNLLHIENKLGRTKK